MSFLQIPIQLYPNTVLGYGSLQNASAGYGNIAIGRTNGGSAGGVSNNNIFIGDNSGGNGSSISVKFRNVFVGTDTGLNSISADDNTFIGNGAGSLVTTGSKNSILGSYNGNQGGLDIRTLSNYIVLSDGDGNPRLWIDNTGAANIPGGFVLSGGTANGVLYLNGSKVVTSGSGLIFDSSGNLGIGTTSPVQKLVISNAGAAGLEIGPTIVNSAPALVSYNRSGGAWTQLSYVALAHVWQGSGSEQMRLDSSGNLGLGVTPSASWFASSKAIQIGSAAAPYLALFQQTTSTSDGYMAWGARLSGDRTFAYQTTGDAVVAYRQNAGVHAWFNAPSGTAGNAISFTQALTLDANRNLALNTTSVGTSAVGALSIGSGTEPSSGPADTVQLYSVDRSAGNTIPAFYCEGTGVTNAGITNTTVTHKIAMKINGTVYYLLATTNAT